MSNKVTTFLSFLFLYPEYILGQNKMTGPFCPKAIVSKLITLVLIKKNAYKKLYSMGIESKQTKECAYRGFFEHLQM
jgi:hypothetical protein